MIDPEETKKKKTRHSLKKFIPKISYVENSSSQDLTHKDISKKEHIKKHRKISSSDDFDIPKISSHTKKHEIEKISYEYFNSLSLEDKHEIMKQLVKKSSESSNLSKKYRIIINIILFLTKFEKLKSLKCFELSKEHSECHIFSASGSKTINLFNAFIPYKTVQILLIHHEFGEFLNLFKRFRNVTIELIKKESSRIYNKAISLIQDLYDDNYHQFNVDLIIEKEIVNEDEFSGNELIASVFLSPEVKYIDEHAFFGCTSLQKVTFSDSVEEIMVGAFQKCTSLLEINIPNSVHKILEYAFSSCTSLQKVTLSSSLKVIRTGVFQDCSSLTQIKIPNSVKRIEGIAFADCVALERIKASSSVKFNSSAFNNCACFENELKTEKKNKNYRRRRHIDESSSDKFSDDDSDSFD